MAALPAYVGIVFDSIGESFDASVERTEMERGVPKQRVLNSRVMMRVGATLYFSSLDDAQSFEDWYFDELGRIGWFSMSHPRTGLTISARFPGGDIGTLSMLGGAEVAAQREVTVEYLR